jgi:hypothetical protein
MYAIAILVIGGILLVTATARTAEERGRMGGAWGALTAMTGVAGFFIGSAIYALALGKDDGAGASPFLLAATFAPALGASACMAATLVYVYSLPPHVVTGVRRWHVHRAGSAHRDGVDGVLTLDDDGLCFAATGETGAAVVACETWPRAAIELVRGDGEAVRVILRDGAGSELFYPTHGPDRRDWRVRQSDAIARAVAQVIARA